MWPRIAAPVVAAAEEAAEEAEEAALEAAEPVVEALVSVVVTEPDRVVLEAVDCALPVVVSLVLPVVVPEAVAAVPVALEEPEDEVQEMVLGRSVTPPREQMPLATWRVAARNGEDTGQQIFRIIQDHRNTYSLGRPESTCQPHSRQCCSGTTCRRKCTGC